METDGWLLVVGALVICAGVALVAVPAAVILAGVSMCALTILLRDQ